MTTPTSQHAGDLPEGRLLYPDPRVLLCHPLNIRRGKYSPGVAMTQGPGVSVARQI